MRSMLIRTAKTFVAAAVSSAATMVPALLQSGVEVGKTAVVAVVASSVAAGITAVMNLPVVKKFFHDYGEKP